MDRAVQAIANNTTFTGYVVVDWDSVFGTTTCPNKAVSMAIERVRTGGEGLAEFVKVYRVASMGQYHTNPGERIVYEFDWNNGLKELMFK